METLQSPSFVPEEKSQDTEEFDTSKKVFRFLERIKFLEMRQLDEEFEKWFQNISYEQYADYLTRMNGMLRDIGLKDRLIDGKGVQISFGKHGDTSYIPPDDSRKESMMQEVFNGLKEIPDNNDRALLAYYSLQAIHPFADGNGRTGRLVYEILSESGKEMNQESLSILLDHDKAGSDGVGEGRDTFAKKVMPPEYAYEYINREVVKDLLGSEFLNQYGKIFYSSNVGISNVPDSLGLTSEEKRLTESILGEADVPNLPFRGIVIVKLLQEKGRLDECRYEISRTLGKEQPIGDNIGKKILAIDNEKFEQSLTAEDVSRLVVIHKELKERFMKVMVDIFTHPDLHVFTNPKGERVPIKSAFRLE